MPDFIALDALVGQTAVNAPDRIAVIDGERQLSYAGLNDLINRVAASLQADGLQPRDVISICALSSIQYVATFLGDLEAVLAAHDDVVEAAVVAMPSEEWGEMPVAFVVLKRELRDWRLARQET